MQLITLVACAAAATGCAGSTEKSATPRFGVAGTSAAPPATVASVTMTGSTTGWAVWPSGSAWLLLSTADGWRDVENRTPPAVPTGGGLIGAYTSGKTAVAVGAYERLTSSPLVTSIGPQTSWTAAELPGAVVTTRDAVSLASGAVTAIVAGAGGTVVRQSGTGWTRLTAGASLAPAGDLTLEGIAWASAQSGWVTGSSSAGTPAAFHTADGGKTWTPVAVAGGQVVAALAPCGSGNSWLLPVINSAGFVTVERSADGGASWTPGAALPVTSGQPAWGCHGAEIWLAGRAGKANRIFASVDAGSSWADSGSAPVGLTDLTPTGPAIGFAAVTAKAGAQLFAVAGAGARLTPIALPSWAAELGAGQGTS